MHAKVHNLILLLFIGLLMQLYTPLAWGVLFSKNTIFHKKIYLQLAQEKKLWNNPQWIRLGHYEKTLFGYESPFRGHLFIDQEGFQSPEKELLKTIEVFFDESEELQKKYKRHPQCQFLARRRWLVNELKINTNDLIKCEERQAWKTNLNAKSVSLIFAASDLSNPASSFGHTFLKLINPENAKNKDLIDYGVNYAANADSSEGFLYALKGMMGFYGGVFTMLPYHQKIREYINIEGRDIWEYQLNFSPEEVDILVDHLLELDSSAAPYYFFTKNCSYHILKTLEVINPKIDFTTSFTSFVIPIDTVKVVERQSSLIQNRVFKKSLKTDYISSYSQLNLLQKKALSETVDKLSISDNYELDNKEKAEVYETAMKYLAIKAYRTGKDLDNEVYTLSSARATLGAITSDFEERTTQPPEQSHDSSALYLGGGLLNNSNETQISYYSIKFRAVFHDLEQPDFGAVHMSQTEMGGLELRHYPKQKKTVFNRFTLLNLINTNPVTQLDNNLSWKVRVEITNGWKYDLEAGGGMSFDYNIGEATRLSYFISTRLWQEQDVNYAGAGPEALLIVRPTADIGTSASLTYFGILKKESFLRLKFKLNYNLKRNFDIQLQAENLVNNSTDTQLRLVNNFLF